MVAVSCGVAAVPGNAAHRTGDRRRPSHLVETDVELQPLAVAKLIKAVVDKEVAATRHFGKQAIDDDANQTGQMLAALLGWPQATFASKVVVDGRQGHRHARSRRWTGNLSSDAPRPLSLPTCA